MKILRSMKFWQSILVALVFALGLGVRLLDLTDPPLDFHPVRQLRSAIISRSLWMQLDPAADPLKRQEAVHLADLQEVLEPPVIEGVVALTYRLIGTEQVWVGRLYAIFIWMLGGWALYRLARRFASPWAALLGLAFYLFLPFGVQASRAFQPDPWMVGLLLVTAWLIIRWQEKPTWGRLVALGLVGGFTILIKVVAGLFIAPMMIFAVLFFQPIRKLVRNPQIYTAAGLMLAPSILYYLVFHGQRAGSYFSFWTISMAGMLLTSNFYADWLAMIGSLTGLTLFLAALLGLALMKKEIRPVALGLWTGYVLYGLTWPFQYTTHEYYHLSLVAVIGLCLPAVLDAVLAALKNQVRFWRIAAVVMLVAFSGYWLYVSRSVLVGHNYRNEPIAWQRIGQAIPTDGNFILLTNDYGLRLGYYGWRLPERYWPSSDDLSLRSLRGGDALDTAAKFEAETSGLAYFVVTSPAELAAQPDLQSILERYPQVAAGDGYTIYDLRKAPTP